MSRLLLRLRRCDAPPAAFELASGEHQRLAQFGSPARRQQFLAGRWLLRQLLAEWLGSAAEVPAIDIDAQGRSHVALRGCFVNLSHSGAWLAGVVADQPVGIDIEDMQRQRDFLALAAAALGPAQCEALRLLDEPRRAAEFYRSWTLREAWLKCRGLGLDMGLMRGLDFEAAAAGPSACALLPIQGVVLALNAAADLPEDLSAHLPWQRYRALDARPASEATSSSLAMPALRRT